MLTMSFWTFVAALGWAVAALSDPNPETAFMALLLCALAVFLQGFEDATK